MACYTNHTAGVFEESTAHRVLSDLSSDGVSGAFDLAFELVVFGLFLSDYLLNFYLARDKLQFVVSPVAARSGSRARPQVASASLV